VCVLRGRWRNTIVLNVHAPSEEKNGDSKDSVYEELEQVFDHMEIILGNLNAKVGGERIFFKPTTGNESLHQDRVEQFALRSINLFIIFGKKSSCPRSGRSRSLFLFKRREIKY